MSWMSLLYQTYENCKGEVGKFGSGNALLLPIYHTTQQAQIEGMIDSEGNWCPGRGRVVTDKKDMTTLIPCTEKSASRSGIKPVPHPLFDKLQYLAKGISQYQEKKKENYEDYIALLTDWCDSPYGHESGRAVRTYLEKGTLLQDLAADGLLYRASDGTFPEKWTGDKEEMPEIFKVAPNQLEAFVRFQVVDARGAFRENTMPWKDATLWESWIAYQNHLDTKVDVCYVTGNRIPASQLSPKKIRNSGDGAKLISGNDSSGLTFRGRFNTSEEACCVGREITEKAHNALRWLIAKQGAINGDQVVLAWGSGGEYVPNPTDDSLDMTFSLEEAVATQEPVITTKEEFAKRFSKALSGYGHNLKGGETAAVIGLDSATPGRLSIFYYREMKPTDLLARIASWHRTCSWLHEYRQVPKETDEKGKPVYVRSPFVGAPSPKDIAEAAYGRNVDAKLKKTTVERILPCIVDGARLPRDLMQSAARRAAAGVNLENWEAQKTLGIACALIRKYYNDQYNRGKKAGEPYEEVWKMNLDPNEKDRDYLWGRALAYAQKIESFAIGLGDEKRNTNAERMKVALTQHPAKTWGNLERQLQPYVQRLRGKGDRLCEGMYQVLSAISKEDFDNRPVKELFFLGYACQMEQFRQERNLALKNKNAIQSGDQDKGQDGEPEQNS